MAKKKKKDEIVGRISLNGKLTSYDGDGSTGINSTSNTKKISKNVVASIGIDGTITPTVKINDTISNNQNKVVQKTNTIKENNNINIQQIDKNKTMPTFLEEAENIKESAKKYSKEPSKNIEKNKKQPLEEKKIAKDNLKLAKSNLSSKDKEFETARKEYQNKLSEEYKENNIDFQNKFDSKINKQISYQTKDSDKAENKPKVYDLKEVNKQVESERKNAEAKLNDLKLAQYQYNSAKVNTEDTTMVDKTIGNVFRGVKDLGSIFTAGSNKYTDENGKEYFLPTYNQLKQEKVSGDYNSGLGKILGDATYNATKILGSTAVDAVTGGIGGKALYWTDMATDNFQNVKNQGYDNKRAGANTLVSTGLNFLTGKLIGSATKGLTGGSTSNVSNALSNATNKLIKNPKFANIIGSMGSEALEEFSQEYLENINRLVTLENSTNLKDYAGIFTDKDILQDALYSAGVGAISSGAISSIDNNDSKNVSDNIKVFEEFRNQLQQKKKTLTNQSEIDKYDNVIANIDNYLSNPFTNNSENVTNQIANTVNALNLGQNQTVTNKNIVSNINNQNIGNSPNIGINNTKVDFISSAKQNNIDVNTETVKTINSKLLERGIKAKFDPNEFTNSNENAFWRVTKDENGNVTREVVFNPNAKTEDLLQNVAVHELYHDIANSKDGQKISKQLLDFASTKEGYAEARQSLEQLYAQKYDSKSKKFQTLVNEEAVASILGKKLGNQEFISQLTTEQPTLSRTVYNWVVDKLNKLNKLTGYKSEKLFWADVKNKFDNAYRASPNIDGSNTKFMVTGYNGAKQLDRNMNTTEFSKNYKEALQLEKQGKSKQVIRKQTGWYKDVNGDWKFEISDESAKLKITPKTNTIYKLNDLMYHNFIYDMYKKLGDTDVKFIDIEDKIQNGKKRVVYGYVNKVTGKIYLNNKIINNKNKILETLLHEVQHKIQKNENFQNGTYMGKNKNKYDNNFGEMEARETWKRKNLTLDERIKNPSFTSIYDGINSNEKIYTKEDNKWYTIFGGNISENSENSKGISKGTVREDVYNTLNEELDNNSSFSFKQKQLEIIKNNNPVYDDYHTWIRSADDIKTFEETLQDSDYKEYYEAGEDFDETYTANMAKTALETGKITIYSSYPIEQGIFVSPSRMEAESYSGNGKVYSKEVNLKDVAWIDPTQGQYAHVDDKKYSQQSNKWDEHLNQYYQTDGTGQTLSQVRNKVMNPLEIANLKPEDANTTPNLNKLKVETGNGKSSFYNNITNKTKMLSEENRTKLSTESDIEFYKEVTNKEALDEAFQKLNENGASETLNWINKKSDQATATDIAEGWILLKQYQDAGDYDSMVQVAKKMREMGTKAGQTVQAFNIMSRLTPEGMVKYAQSELTEAYNQMVKNKTKEWINKNASNFDLTPQETQFIVDTMKEVATMEDGYNKKVKLAEIQKMLQDKLPPEKGAGIKSWMRISMLFNPKTQVRNIMGNAIITPVNALSDTFSALVDKQIAKKTGIRTIGNTSIKNYSKGFKKGLYQSYNDFKKGINTRDMQGNRFEIGQGKSFKNDNILGKNLNKVDSILNFALDAGDRPFYEATFTNSINNQLVLNNTTEITQDMIDIATQEALSRTWQDNNGYTKMVLDIRKNLNRLNVRGYGLGDVLIPFAKTPANLTKAIVDYSPLGLVNTIIEGNNLKKSLSNGQYDIKQQHKFAQDLGKATAGTMLYVLGYALAKAKITSGENDEDKDVADFMKNTLGIQPYSIKIGNKTFTYDWAQPVAAPFAITANYLNNTNEKAKLHEKVLSAMDTGLNLIFEQSFMSSIQNVLSSYDGLTEGMINQILDLPSRAVPTFLKQINDLVDGTTRTSFEKGEPVKTATNKVKTKIPGLSAGLATSRDSLGRKIEKYGGENNPFNVFMNPANTNKGKESISAKEIYRVYKETGDKSIMPRVAPYSIQLNGKGKTLSAEERSEFQKISGEIVEENVKKLTTNKKYNKLSDEDKAEVIYGIVGYAYNKAKSEVLDTEVSTTYKTANKYVEKGGALYDFYANKVYKNRD